MGNRIMWAILRWLPACAWMALIFWFSSQPDLPRPPGDLLNLVVRKTAHFCVYGVLAILYVWALRGWHMRRWAFLLAVLYAISDEFHQSFTPNRHPAATDVIIDSAGAFTALWCGPWLQRRITARRAQSWAVDHGPASAEEHA